MIVSLFKRKPQQKWRCPKCNSDIPRWIVGRHPDDYQVAVGPYCAVCLDALLKPMQMQAEEIV